MGDIYHKIKATVDKMTHGHLKRMQRKDPDYAEGGILSEHPETNKQSALKRLKMSESEESF